jgi:hypothetical protein
MLAFLKTTVGKVIVGVVVVIIIVIVAVVAFSGSSQPNASQVLKSDGYSQVNLGVQNTAPAEISSEAFGVNNSTGQAEIVFVLTPQGQAKAPQVEQEFNAANTGLSITDNGSVLRVDGSVGQFAAIGEGY